MEPNDALAKAVRRLGTGLALDAPRTRGILADYGVSKRLVSALVAAVEAGVASEATLGRAGEPEASRFDRLARQLHEQMATDEALARWAVEAWAAALRPVSGDLIRDAEGGGGSPIDRPVRDRSRAGRDSTNGGRGGPTDGWIAPQADLDDSSGPEPEAYDDGRQADGDQAPDRQRGEDPQAGVEPGKTQRDDRGWPDRSADGPGPPEQTDDEPVIAESTTPVSGPGPKRKRRRALVAVVVTAVATSAGVVVVVWRHREITVCGPSSKTLCVVGGPYALVDSRRTGHDQTLRSGQTITSNGGSPAVRVRSRGNEVFLDRGTSVRVLGDGTLSLRTGRLWVLSAGRERGTPGSWWTGPRPRTSTCAAQPCSRPSTAGPP